MPYVDGDTDSGRRWVSDRDLGSLRDQLRLAAEQLASDVETYLYDKNSGVWMSPEFLSWAVARYDAVKVGSGNHANFEYYGHDEAVQQPIAKPEDRKFPNAQRDDAVRFPEHAHEADHINTGASE